MTFVLHVQAPAAILPVPTSSAVTHVYSFHPHVLVAIPTISTIIHWPRGVEEGEGGGGED